VSAFRLPELSQEQIDAAESIARVDDSVVRAALARVPPAWKLIQLLPAGGAFMRGSIQVLYTVQRYSDGNIWVHASACGRTGANSWHLPTFEDLKRIKHDFIGEDRWAYQVFPSAKDYVNQHPYVLHLYALMDGSPALPDFTWGLGTI
jgi:hypothetical protein